MRVSCWAIIASWFLISPALAAERSKPPIIEHECETVEILRAETKGAKVTLLNAGQFHFMQGAYSATPPLSPPPPADSAVLVQVKGKNFIAWMKGAPACLTSIPPMPVDEKFVAIVRAINPGHGETIEPADSNEERKL
jgi:hypothetical protein